MLFPGEQGLPPGQLAQLLRHGWLRTKGGPGGGLGAGPGPSTGGGLGGWGGIRGASYSSRASSVTAAHCGASSITVAAGGASGGATATAGSGYYCRPTAKPYLEDGVGPAGANSHGDTGRDEAAAAAAAAAATGLWLLPALRPSPKPRLLAGPGAGSCGRPACPAGCDANSCCVELTGCVSAVQRGTCEALLEDVAVVAGGDPLAQGFCCAWVWEGPTGALTHAWPHSLALAVDYGSAEGLAALRHAASPKVPRPRRVTATGAAPRAEGGAPSSWGSAGGSEASGSGEGGSGAPGAGSSGTAGGATAADAVTGPGGGLRGVVLKDRLPEARAWQRRAYLGAALAGGGLAMLGLWDGPDVRLLSALAEAAPQVSLHEVGGGFVAGGEEVVGHPVEIPHYPRARGCCTREPLSQDVNGLAWPHKSPLKASTPISCTPTLMCSTAGAGRAAGGAAGGGAVPQRVHRYAGTCLRCDDPA